MIGQSSRLAVEGGEIVSHAPSRAHWLARTLSAVAKMTPPVVATIVTLAFAWQMRTTPFVWFDGILSPPGEPELYPSHWLTIAHAVVPVAFFVNILANRRYGEHFAIAHVIAANACAALLAVAMVYRVVPSLPIDGGLPSVRVIAAFGAAMALSQLLGVFVFDRTRGIEWWRAPLYGALASSFAFVFIFYPVAFAGGDWIWLNHLSVDAGVKAAMSFALLAPYLILRPVVRPLGGLGGY